MNKEDIYNKIATKWRDQKGIGSVYAIDPINPYELAIYIINLVRNKNPNSRVFIYCNEYPNMAEMGKLVSANKLEHVSIVTNKYIRPTYKYEYDLCIALGFAVLLDNHIQIINQSKFRFVALAKYVSNPEIYKQIDRHYPIIRDVMTESQANAVRNCFPVEEWRVSLELDIDKAETYKKYTDYIIQSIQIFGSMDMINDARMGNKLTNVSGATIRDHIARQNGWSEYLDTTIPFNKQIDEFYNPNALLERANVTYNIMRERNLLITNNEEKIPKIVQIVEENKNKRILIVSKHGEFARKITKALVDAGYNAGNYHDCIEPMKAYDANGIPILIKSGIHKGEHKIVKAKAISSENLRRFNLLKDVILNESNTDDLSHYFGQGSINVLSIKNASSVELECTADVVIFTSALYADWKEFKYRYNKLKFVTNPILIYKLYYAGTIEEREVLSSKETDTYKIHEKEKLLVFDENTGQIVCR